MVWDWILRTCGNSGGNKRQLASGVVGIVYHSPNSPYSHYYIYNNIIKSLHEYYEDSYVHNLYKFSLKRENIIINFVSL